MDVEPGPNDFERQLVELTEVQSVHEAETLAERLRAHGVVALAKVDAVRGFTSRGVPMEYLRSHVVVASTDRERALQLLIDEMPREGALSDEEIERELEQGTGEDDDGAGEEPGASPVAGVQRAWVWLARVAIVTFVAAAVVVVLRGLLFH